MRNADYVYAQPQTTMLCENLLRFNVNVYPTSLSVYTVIRRFFLRVKNVYF